MTVSMTSGMDAAMDAARAVADAVLYEGYLLYPYRASAAKNRMRWQWGVLMPPSYASGGTGERAAFRTELIAEPADDAILHARLRFLQLQRRIVEVPDGAGGDQPVAALTVAGTEYTTWEEAVEREVDAAVPFADLLGGEEIVRFDIDGGEETEPIPGGEGARLVRRREKLCGELRVRADALPGPYGGVKLSIRVANIAGRLDAEVDAGVDAEVDAEVTAGAAAEAGRYAALRYALIAAHALLYVSGGHFLSATDPPEWASVVTRECSSDGAWPVLVGEPGRRDTVLCTPIILSDFPAIAEQSAGNLFDGTEIDEILTLRTMTLTDEEKRQARATDERAAELIDRVDNLPPEVLDRLHGTIRYLRDVTGDRPVDREIINTGTIAAPDAPWWDPGADTSVSPETDQVMIEGVRVGKGSRVRLRPSGRADAHDMFLAGRVAVVQAVLLDVDERWHLAVTLEDDLGSELYAAHGRYRYFGTDEVEPL